MLRLWYFKKPDAGRSITKLSLYYLKGIRDFLILNPRKSDFKITYYVGVDFSGLWKHEDAQDPHCVRSRTSFVVIIAGCPIIWNSTLQN